MWPFRKKYDFKWLRNVLPLQNQFEYTPDRLWLERHPFVWLFVYDEMMRGRSLYHLIGEDSVYGGVAFTSPDWTMWKKKLGEESFAISMNGSSLGKRGRVKGEIHLIRPHVLWNTLDKRMLNGVEFRRERVHVFVPYHLQHGGMSIDSNEFVQELRVHMYVGIPEVWNNQIDNGYLFSPVARYKPRVNWVDGHVMGEYYFYSRLEYATNF